MPTRLELNKDSSLPTRLAMPILPTTDANDAPPPNQLEVTQHTRPITVLSPGSPSKYRSSLMYEDIIGYREKGSKALQDRNLTPKRIKAVKKPAAQYKLPTPATTSHLLFTEANGRDSICIVEEEIPRFLHPAHEDHGHYSAALTLEFLIGRAYWPKRARDVEDWCRNCKSCQLRMKKPMKGVPRTNQHFKPMAMIGADWLGPISPACTATGFRYVLIIVDYFTRFVWAKTYLFHTVFKTIHMLREHVAPVFGWPVGFYTDDGSYFVTMI